jgi:formylglycine-generating enzyme
VGGGVVEGLGPVGLSGAQMGGFLVFRSILAAVALVVAPGFAAPAEAPRVIENSLGMRLVLIPAGDFQMGREESPMTWARDFPQYARVRFEKLDDEAPRHRVRITRPFWLGQTEVTVGQFRRFLAASGYRPESERDGTGGYGYNPDYDPSQTVRGDAFEGRDPRYSWQTLGFPQTDADPVLNVTWNDAVALAEGLTRTEGQRYRLPTEAEWEYACLAGAATRWPNGDAPAQLAAIANVFDADAAVNWPRWQVYALGDHDGFAFTAPVGHFAPNAFGLYDMIGNAWEWVADWYGEDYYAQAATEDPQGPPTGDRKVRRGGSWHSWPFYARCSFRNWNTPQSRYTLLGMRLARDADDAPGMNLKQVASPNRP